MSTETEAELAALANDLEDRCEHLTDVIVKLRAKCKRLLAIRRSVEIKQLHAEIVRLHGEISHLVSGE